MLYKIDLSLGGYQRGSDGVINNVEDARKMIKSLLDIFNLCGPLFLLELPKPIQMHLTSFILGATILSLRPDEMSEESREAIDRLKSFFGEELFYEVVGLAPMQEEIDPDQAVKWVEQFFKDQQG